MQRVDLPEQTLTRIGEGAMARVFLAEHPSFGAVALKVLRAVDAHAWQRLLREAGAQSRLAHPHIGRVFGITEHQGQPALVLQHIQGQPLDEVADGLVLEARVGLLLQVCDAVEHAHAQGLVHRDLKPGNVLVETRADGEPHAFVLDFGLARDADAASLTGTGEVLGTPAYMAPEQALGNGALVDRRTDVHALGAILFRLLTGRLPFEGGSIPEVMRRVASEDAPLAHQISANVPRALSRICARCLAKSPSDRYPSARALREDLERWLRGDAVDALAFGPAFHARRLLRRHRFASLTVLAVLPVLLVWGLQAFLAGRESERREQLAAEVVGESESLRSALRIAHLAPPQALDSTVAELGARLDMLERRIDKLGGRAAAQALQAIGQARLALDQPERAIAVLRRVPVADPGAPDADGLLAQALLAHYEDQAAPFGDRPASEVAELVGSEARALLVEARTRLLKSGTDSALALARLALLEQRFDDALATLDTYKRTDVADVAALVLHAEIEASRGRLALERGEQGAGDALRSARAQLDAALLTQRSDARLHQMACRIGADQVRLAGQNGEAPPSSLDGVHAGCATASLVRPDRAAGFVAQAMAWSAIATAHRTRQSAGEERAALLAMRDAAAQAALLAPQRPEPALALARAEASLAELRDGSAEAAQQRLEDALIHVGQAQERFPTYPPLLRERARLQRALGRFKSNHGIDPASDYALAIRFYREALRLTPEAVGLMDDLSLTHVFAFYEARVKDPQAAIGLAETAIALLDDALALRPDHPDLLSTQAFNRADLWSFRRALAGGEAPASLTPGWDSALADFERLRRLVPQRPDGHFGALMLALTACDLDHDRGIGCARTLALAHQLAADAESAGVPVPDGLSAWLAVEAAREALATDESPAAALRAARELLESALADRSDVDAFHVAARTDLELAVAELRWRQRTDQSLKPALTQGLARFEDLKASGREFGDGWCDGGELLMVSSTTAAPREAKALARQAANAYRTCISSSPFVNAHHRPRLEAIERVADDMAGAAL